MEEQEKQEEATRAVNGNETEETEDQKNFKDVNLEENIRKEYQEKSVSLGEDPVNETPAERDEGLKEKTEDEQNQTEEVTAESEAEEETREIPKASEEEKETQLEKSGEAIGSLNPNPHHPNSVEEQQQEGNVAIPGTTVAPGPQIPDPADPNPTAGHDKKIEVEARKDEGEVKQRPSPPKVLSAMARFQCQASSQGFQVKSRVKAFAEPGRPCTVFRSREMPCNSDTSETNNRTEAPEEEDQPPVKVSELKKRFEA